MEVLRTATLLLETNGVWFVCVVEGTAIVAMARYIAKLHSAQRKDDKNTISMLEGFKASVDALTKAIDRLIDKSRGG